MVCEDCSLNTINGHKKSFQTYMNLIIANVAKAGIITGIAIFQYTLILEQPSIFAASTSSSGTLLLIYCLIQKIPNASISPGTIMAFKSFNQSNLVMIINCGINPNWGGIVIVIRTNKNNMFLPLN